MKSKQQSPVRRINWRYFVQFSLRSLLVLTTVAGVGCWWFLQPRIREERLGQTPLVLRREIRLAKVDLLKPLARGTQLETINGQRFAVVNAGRWRMFGAGSDLLVDGRYVNGKPHGKWTIYHVNGRKAVEGVMMQGEKLGRWRTWDEEGRLVSEVEHAAMNDEPPRGGGG